MYRVSHRTGRLVEIAIWSPVSVDEAVQWGKDHDTVIDRVHGSYVCFVDLRGATIFPPEVVSAYVGTMRTETRLERTGTLLPQSATVALQISRMIRQAGHPNRRAFEESVDLLRWFEEVLDESEQRRLVEIIRNPAHRSAR